MEAASTEQGSPDDSIRLHWQSTYHIVSFFQETSTPKQINHATIVLNSWSKIEICIHRVEE
jgi:hypothetical protein